MRNPLRRRRSRPEPPSDLLAAVDLPRGERVLAAAPLVDPRPGLWALATEQALVLAAPEGPLDRRGWEVVDHGSWDDDSRVLEVTWTDGAPPLRLRLDGEDSFLPEVLRERVQATVVVSRRVDVRGRRGVRVAVRRAPGSGEMFSEVLADRGVDVDDPAVRPRVAEMEADLRSQAGLPPRGGA